MPTHDPNHGELYDEYIFKDGGRMRYSKGDIIPHAGHLIAPSAYDEAYRSYLLNHAPLSDPELSNPTQVSLDDVLEATPAPVVEPPPADPEWYPALLRLIFLRQQGVAKDIQLWIRELNPQFSNLNAMLATCKFIAHAHEKNLLYFASTGLMTTKESQQQARILNATIKAAWTRWGDSFSTQPVLASLLMDGITTFTAEEVLSHYQWLKSNKWSEVSNFVCGRYIRF